MESKSIKIVDEHGIDRDAVIIYTMDVDGTDYVVYSISRDDENDNIFISKIIRNIDGTSSMVNIEDSNEKAKVFDVVKRMIKFAVNSPEDNLNSLSVTLLEDGKTIKLSKVLFNKEQNINVTKTYLTTVKKSVTKVTLDYYKYQDVVTNSQPIVEPVKEENVEPDFPDIFPAQSNIQEPAPVAVPVLDNVENTPLPAFFSTQENSNNNFNGNDNASVVDNTVLENVPKVEQVVEPNLENVAVPNVSVAPSVVVPPQEVTPVLDSFTSVNSQVVTDIPSVAIQPEPVSVVTNPQPVVEPEIKMPSSTPINSDSMLIFDGSKETNLNQALGEVSNEGVQAVSNIESVREFGMDEPVSVSADNGAFSATDSSVGASSSPSGGFIQSKFFMIIAIVFFLASCVFLGYEAFNYFKIK